MAGLGKKSGKSGNKKHGRNAICCNQYRLEHRREKSKARRLLKHITNRPADMCARNAYYKLPASVATAQLPRVPQH